MLLSLLMLATLGRLAMLITGEKIVHQVCNVHTVSYFSVISVSQMSNPTSDHLIVV